MRYRPEIDGLRAVAVLAVLLNHAKSDYFIGGFIGVDIFFVISGFLLRSITIGDIEKGRFSLWRFYERRVRRIIPALLAVCSVTTAAAFMLLGPDTVRHYLESLVATLLFGANFYFYFETDYFAPSSELELLLHTWSLGVEEQFYLFFPALFLFFYVRRKIVPAAALVLIASLCLALSAGDQLAVFYLLPYRAWEFAVGALVALYLHKQRANEARQWLGEAAVSAGIVLMVCSAIFTPEGGTSTYLILPVAGAAAVILYGNRSVVARYVLANPVMTYIGAISYSLYLWHQPIFVIARERSVDDLRFLDYLPLLGLTLVLSHLTYRLVETPFRNRERMTFGRVPLYLAGLALPMIVFGPVLHAGVTLPTLKFDGALGQYVNYDAGEARSATWHALNRYRPTNLPVKIAVVGNSHAKDMWNALQLSPAGNTVEFIPLVSNRECTISRRDRYFRLVLPRRAAHEQIQACETSYPFLNEYLATVSGVVIAPLWDQAHVDHLGGVLSKIRDYHTPVLVVGNTARFTNVPRAVRSAVLSGTSEIPAINRAIAETRWDESAINRQIRDIARQYDALFLDRESLVCPPSGCDLTFAYGHITLADSGHWTLDGANRFSSRMYRTGAMQRFMTEAFDFAHHRQHTRINTAEPMD